ncbi:MAG TPA: cytochrome c [Candidatus Acidoferrum sp.]|jgi:mono/diheme cytochrome c family protein
MNRKRNITIILGAALVGLVLHPARALPDEASAKFYKQKCASCHGPDGKAETPAGKAMKVRSFADPAVVAMSDDELAAVITKGKGKMPKYGASLKPDQIKPLVEYCRSLAK